jgi:cell division protein FtsW (lipid II flippase)
MSSRIGYPGLVVATGVGWLVLLDLSFSAHAGNRYLALYHQGHLWLALLTLSVVVFVRAPLARGCAWLLSVAGEALGRASRRIGAFGVAALLVGAALAALLAFGVVLAHTSQITSEIGRVWLIVGAAWFFFLRAGPLTERLAKDGRAALSFVRYAWPLLFVVGVLVAAMFVTHDMGPLLIAGYAGGAFLAAAVAMWWHHRSGRVALAFALALVLFALWIAAVTAALFQVGAYDSVTASRLESVAAPFASINDQLALAWVVLTSCQLAVTVAGNLAVLPLTGVTFPFVSFGMTSLVVNAAFLALSLNLELGTRSRGAAARGGGRV